jgi:hypothetical protein
MRSQAVPLIIRQAKHDIRYSVSDFRFLNKIFEGFFRLWYSAFVINNCLLSPDYFKGGLYADNI